MKRREHYQLDALASVLSTTIEAEERCAANDSPPVGAIVAQTVGARVTSRVRTSVQAASSVARAIGNSMSPKRPIRRSKRSQQKQNATNRSGL